MPVIDLPAPDSPSHAQHLALADVERTSSTSTWVPRRGRKLAPKVAHGQLGIGHRRHRRRGFEGSRSQSTQQVLTDSARMIRAIQEHGDHHFRPRKEVDRRSGSACAATVGSAVRRRPESFERCLGDDRERQADFVAITVTGPITVGQHVPDHDQRRMDADPGRPVHTPCFFLPPAWCRAPCAANLTRRTGRFARSST